DSRPGHKIGRDGRSVCAHHRSPRYCALDYGDRTALSFQVRSRRFHDSCLPVALPAALAIAGAAPHLTGTLSVAYLPQVRHGESVLWRTGAECCAFGQTDTLLLRFKRYWDRDCAAGRWPSMRPP